MDAAHKIVRTEPAVIAEGEVSHEECRGFADMLARIGDKWTVLIVGSLASGPLRYKELHRKVEGISQRMLTLTLKGLEEDGLVSRTVYPTIPPRVDYELTELGRTLIVPLATLYKWMTEHKGEIADARQRYAEAQANKPMW
ncbi:winged helix-turn-helix transcriptional regulator [Flaviflagellibacter deserti]|uniref:Winged helix-turn-helix transcriptional regulator n=1 Tax=Flaviflagellibacter deserti TaxID=2267266 RepID=A0ABV9YZT9_9HYPH